MRRCPANQSWSRLIAAPIIVPAKEARDFRCGPAMGGFVGAATDIHPRPGLARVCAHPCLPWVKQNPAERPTAGLGPVPKPQGTRYQVQLIKSLNVSRFPCLTANCLSTQAGEICAALAAPNRLEFQSPETPAVERFPRRA